jgi:thiamine-phosphate pyrophosphorylase
VSATPLPSLLLLTDRRRAAAAGRSLTATVAAAVEAGVEAVLLREKDLPAPQRRQLAGELAELTAPAGALLGIASDVELARSVGSRWVHLARHQPRPAATDGLVVGRSCHGPGEARRAASEGCAYVTISPVASSSSKPGYGPTLGVEGLRLVRDAVPRLPLVALGGVDATNVHRWVPAGADGVAVMGAVMGADDPAAVTRALLAALAGCAVGR